VTPNVAYVVATYNEERRIGDCLAALLAQDYPGDRLEVIVVDGGSADGTQDVVRRIAATDRRVSVRENPRRIAAVAFNIGARATEADIVSLMSAHAVVDPGYTRELVRAFGESGARLVGGRMVAVSEGGTAWEEAIRRATSSPFGLGNAAFHYSEEPKWVDTAFPGAYQRSLLEELGGFDESLVRNQDDDLHLRARLRGHRMWFDPALECSYHPRSTLAALWRQYFEYGFWRAATLRKHRRFASWRHAVPPLFTAAVAGGAIFPVRPVRRLWALTLAAYGGVLAAGAARERVPSRESARMAAAMAVLHVAYGSGFWAGLAKGAGRG
jgi:succinoglycan biosynthesis protein ExoA